MRAGGGLKGGVRPPASPRSTEERFAARARRNRQRPWRRILIAALVVAAAAAVTWLLAFSPYVVARSVEVEGAQGQEAGAIKALAKVPTGTPMVRIDTGAITDRVRTRASIAEARTSRSWPSTITIKVRLRTPALVMKKSQGQLEVVDATGVVFGEVSAPPPGVPVVAAGSEQGDSTEAVKASLSLIRSLPKDLSGKVSTITVTSANRVTFKLGEVDVVWGGADQPERKIVILRALLRTSPAAIDVSAPDTPVTR